jgi:hypothetical protein
MVLGTKPQGRDGVSACGAVFVVSRLWRQLCC